MKYFTMALWIVLILCSGVYADETETQDFAVEEDITIGSYGGNIIVAALGDPKTFNIVMANETSSSNILNQMYSGLVSLNNATQEYEPALAKGWEHSDDYQEWTFHLRRGIRWSDGKPFTADDVVFSFDVVYDPSIPNAVKDLVKVDGDPFKIEKIDTYTFKVILPDTYGPLLYGIGAVPIIPKHILAPAVKNDTFNQIYNVNVEPEKLVVNGVFKLKEFSSGEKTVLTRNPHYWKIDSKGTRLPYLEKLIFLNVPDMDANLVKFQSGETDIYGFYGDKYKMMKKDEQKGNYTVYELGPGMGTEHLWFNLNPEKNTDTGEPYVDPVKLDWFQKPDFRRAVSHAINRPGIVRAVYRGRAATIYGPVSPANKRWHNPDVTKFEYDPEKAEKLLTGLGFVDRDDDGFREDKDGNKITFTIMSNRKNDYREKIGNIICDSLKRIGLDARLSMVDFNRLVTSLADSYDYEACLLGLTGSLEPVGGMNVYLSSGRTHQWHPNQEEPATEAEAKIDVLMNKYLKAPEYEQQKQYSFEVQRIMAEQQFMIYTVAPYVYVAVRDKFGNLNPTPLRPRVLWNSEKLFVKSKL